MSNQTEFTPIAANQLSNKAIEIVKGSTRIKSLIGLATDSSYATVQRWLNANDRMLTMESVLKVIEKETGLTRKEIIA